MIRKTIIVVLTLVSTVTVALAPFSYRIGAFLSLKPSPHWYVLGEVSDGWLCIEVLVFSDSGILELYKPESGFVSFQSK